MSIFAGKTLMITGGTGSFGNAVLNRFLRTDIGEIRIFSRDEKKQDDMRHEYQMKYPDVAHMSDEGYEQKYVKEAFDTNWVVPMGPNVNAFEEDLRKFVTGNVESAVYQDSRWPEATAAAWNLNPALKNTKVVCLSAGTAAVHLALLACGVGPGDEVCVQSFTFCASSHPITYLGATPVFVDSEPETWNMDPQLLEQAILDRKEKTG